MLSTEPPPQPLPHTAAQLADCFGFALDDLALNRSGELSARQRQTVFFRSWGYLARGVVLAVLGIGITIILARDAHTGRDRALIAVLAMLVVLIVALLLWDGYRMLRPTVKTVTGPLQRGENAWRPSIFVGSTEITITTRRWRRLEAAYPGLYRAYIDPAGYLLSIEPDDKD